MDSFWGELSGRVSSDVCMGEGLAICLDFFWVRRAGAENRCYISMLFGVYAGILDFSSPWPSVMKISVPNCAKKCRGFPKKIIIHVTFVLGR